MNLSFSRPRGQLATMLMIVATVVAVLWAAEGAMMALASGGWLLAFVLLVHFGRGRSDAIAVMSGIGDERRRTLYTRAIAFSGHAVCLLVVIWFLISVIRGTPNETLGVIGAVAGLSFIAGSIYYSVRG